MDKYGRTSRDTLICTNLFGPSYCHDREIRLVQLARLPCRPGCSRLRLFICPQCSWITTIVDDITVTDDQYLPQDIRLQLWSFCADTGFATPAQLRKLYGAQLHTEREGPLFGRVGDIYGERSTDWPELKRRFTVEDGVDGRLKLLAGGLVAEASETSIPTVVEIGGGDGRLTEALAAKAPSGRFVYTDVSFSMALVAAKRLRSTSQKFGVGIKLLVCDAAATPLPSGGADFAFAQFVVHHVPSPLEVLREAARLLKPGGVLLAQTPGLYYQNRFRFGEGPWKKRNLPVKVEPGNLDLLGRFSAHEFEELSISAGLKPTVTYSDLPVYRFESNGDYMHFMEQTGAEAKRRHYVDDRSGSHFYGDLAPDTSSPFRLEMHFVTLMARKEAY